MNRITKEVIQEHVLGGAMDFHEIETVMSDERWNGGRIVITCHHDGKFSIKLIMDNEFIAQGANFLDIQTALDYLIKTVGEFRI